MNELITVLLVGGGLVLAAYLLGKSRERRDVVENELEAVDDAKKDRELLTDEDKRKALEDHYR